MKCGGLEKRDFTGIEMNSKDTSCFEICLQNPKKLAQTLGIQRNKVDCYPLLWVQLDTKV